MNVLDRHSKQRRLVGLGKGACTLLAPLHCGMTVLLTNLKKTRARSGGQIEFHVTDSNVKKVTIAKLAEVKRQTVYTSLRQTVYTSLDEIHRKSDAGVIIQVRLTAWQLLQHDGPVMKLLCFDDQHSILLVLTGPSRDRMAASSNSTTTKIWQMLNALKNIRLLKHPRLDSMLRDRNVIKICTLVTWFPSRTSQFRTWECITHVGMHHSRTTALTIIGVCTSDPPCQMQPIAVIVDRTSFPMITAAMSIPLSAV
jgi:hypothetical protein